MSTDNRQLTLTTPLSLALKNPSANFMAKIKGALEAHDINPTLFLDAVTFELTNQPKLAKCTWGSFLQSLRSAALTGLIPGKLGGKCYLIPYGDECQFQLSYKGIIEIFGRHKIRVRPVTVRENDIFEYDFGAGAIKNHQVVDWDNRGEIKLIYVVYTFSDGTIQVNEPVSRKQIEHIRDNYSQAYKWGMKNKDSIWHLHFDIMALKTAIKQTSKFIQVPYEVAQALTMDDLADRRRDAIDVTSVNSSTQPQNFSAALEQQQPNSLKTNIVDGVDQATGEVVDDNANFEINPAAQAAAQGQFDV